MEKTSSRMSRWCGLVVLVAAVLGACSSNGLPEGFAVYRGDGFSIGAPADWDACLGAFALGGEGTLAVELRSQQRGEEIPPVVQVTNEGAERPLDHAVNFRRLLLQVSPGYRQLREEEVEVTGAQEAVRIDFTQQNALPGQPAAPEIRGISLLAAASGEGVIGVLVTAPSSGFESVQDSLEEVLGSLAVGEEVSATGRSARDLPQCEASP